MTLPEGVEKTSVRKPNGKVYTYYYWNPGRGTDREGERIKLPNADTQPVAFWAEVEHRNGQHIRQAPSAISLRATAAATSSRDYRKAPDRITK